MVIFTGTFVSDIGEHRKEPGFYTVVAGSCILGVQNVLIYKIYSTAFLLWIFTIVIWLLIIYSFLTIIITKEEKPDLEYGLNGLWLHSVVATQSLVILGALLTPKLIVVKEWGVFVLICLFFLGGILYVILITL